MFEPTSTWLDFTFGQFFIWIGANNDQVKFGSFLAPLCRSGIFQMPTCPFSSAASSASTLRGGRANLRNASVTFTLFSSAVPPGSGAFQMPTCPSSAAASAASASTLRGGRANLRNASVTFSLFLHEASLGWY